MPVETLVHLVPRMLQAINPLAVLLALPSNPPLCMCVIYSQPLSMSSLHGSCSPLILTAPADSSTTQAWLANEESEVKCPSPAAALRIDIVCLDSFRSSEDATPVTPGTPVSPIGDWVEADLLRVSGDMHNSGPEDRVESMV